jgi:hypothetical protein
VNFVAQSNKKKITCFYCGNEYVETNFYKSYSNFYSNGKIPYCKQCIVKFYQQYYEKYVNEGCLTPERNAIKRLCMAFDIYYKEDTFNSVMAKVRQGNIDISPIMEYIKQIQLIQYKDKSYDNTILEDEKEEFLSRELNSNLSSVNVDQKTIDFFGSGFTNEDYAFLKREYQDWTARHECNTKAQEEVFKDICFNRLQNLQALRRGEDTKDITAAFHKMLDAGKLQPKQNAGDTTADNQTFGTLIDKWENERPLPEIDEELKDVDKIALYINIFFKGHLSRMMGIKNGFSNLYSKFMKKYTVEKPEYDDDDNSDALFDAVFGGDLKDE